MTSNTRLHNIKEYFLWAKTCVDASSGSKFEYGASVSFSSSSLDKKWLQKEDFCVVFQTE